MMTFLHITFALISLIAVSTAYIISSRQLIVVSVVSAASTLLSGIVMVTLTPSTVTRACITGVVYLAVIVVIGALARQKITRRSSSASM